MRFERCRELFGEDFEAIRRAEVLIIGVGGVGSFALDCLYRSGVERITIVDFDRYDVTNQNRQIGAEAVGELKVDVLARLYPGIKKIEAKIDNNWIDSFNFDGYDLIIDAIDEIEVKVALAKRVSDRLISSMGSAKRRDPTLIRVGSIWETYGDRFAKKVRHALRRSGFQGDFLTVFSPEEPSIKGKGSFVGVTGAFGLALCAKGIEKIIGDGKRGSDHNPPLQRGAGDQGDPHGAHEVSPP
ncbi:MAG: tRNA threonylcarbamoyladenosine dehydratase [Epsilonproteobacteria bacterium]|nr:tRNA cyclic N6-threonylcarbamoyladenosine(37) synthase TcdA [Campylobacterota bacterium]NPA57609.1 tRNA threonylcarbamoyladenosine dehydratase [Campylobacterota bacterium]